MKVVDFGQARCKRIEELLDAYVSGELLVETAHDVERHLASCEGCSQRLRELEALRRLLRRAGRSEPPPSGLEERIRLRVGRQARRPRNFWLAAVAALFLAFAAGWTTSLAVTGHPPHRYLANEWAIQRWLRDVDGMFRLGLGTHAHCAYYRPKWKDELPAEEIVRELGEYAPLSQAVSGSAPAGYELLVAHRCNYLGREYLHFALRAETGLLSVILTPATEEDELPAEFSARTAGGFEATAFAVERYVGFVVSDLPARENAAVAQSVRRPLQTALRSIEG